MAHRLIPSIKSTSEKVQGNHKEQSREEPHSLERQEVGTGAKDICRAKKLKPAVCKGEL